MSNFQIKHFSCFCIFSMFGLLSDYFFHENQMIARKKLEQGFGFTNEQVVVLGKINELLAGGLDSSLGGQEKQKEHESKIVCDAESFDQSQFVTAAKNSPFYQKVTPCVNAGMVFLSALLSGQTNDVAVLKKRATIIDYLHANPEVFRTLRGLLQELSQSGMEEALVKLADDATKEHKSNMARLFITSNNFIGQKFVSWLPEAIVAKYAQVMSNHPYVFGLFNAAIVYARQYVPGRYLESNCLVGFPVLFDSKEKKLLPFDKVARHHVILVDEYINSPRTVYSHSIFPNHWGSKLHSIKNGLRKMTWLSSRYHLDPCAILFRGTLALTNLADGLGSHKYTFPQVFAAGFLIEVCGPWLVSSVTNLYFNHCSTFDYTEHVKPGNDRLERLARGVQVLQSIEAFLEKHPTLKENILSFNKVSSLANQSWGSDRGIQNAVSKPSNGSYFLYGAGLPLYYNVLQNYDNILKRFIPYLAHAGELDAYCCLADRLVGCKEPHLIDDRLQITLSNFIHPHMVRPVENNLDFTVSADKRFILVSGPNGSGKSATTRGFLQQIMSNQTYHKVHAQDAALTVFDKVFISANLSDSLNECSKFQKEKAKLKEVYDYLVANPDKKVLFYIDEPLTSIDTDEVGRLMKNIFEIYRKFNNVLIVCVSNTKSLAQVPNVLHIGMKVGLNKDGTFKPTYRWAEGPAYVNDVRVQLKNLFGHAFEVVNGNA